MAKKKTTKNAAPRSSTPKKAPAKAGKRTASKKAAPTKAPPVKAAEAAPEPQPAKKKRRTKKAVAVAAKKPPAGKRKAPCSKKGKAKGKCASSCSTGTCTKPQLDGRSLYDRARECKDLEECHTFIAEFNEAVEQANRWLDEMHAQALSAEQTRDMYGEQISDLLEAIDADKAQIAELEADLKRERAKGADATATKAVLDTLAELGKEVKTLRSELQRLLEGRGLTSARRQQARKTARTAERAQRGRGRPRQDAYAATEPTTGAQMLHESGGRAYRSSAAMEGRPARRRNQQPPGAFAKYSVLRGAACSLGVGKYGYPPEVCAPASFSRSEAAEILGTYAQNKYSGLAKWAIITGLPIDDIAVPLVPMKPRGTSDLMPEPAQRQQRAAKPARTTPAKAPRTTTKKAAAPERSNKQVLDQVLLTVARI